MDALLYDISIPAISSLQSQLSQHASIMQLMSVVFDPKYAFLIYSPIAYLLDQKVGKKLILTTVIAEWLNQILKWLLHGERPYWYVHSSGRFDPQQVPIKQFPITCELGPGHPSGHAMVTAAVWYIILDALLQAYNQHHHRQHHMTIATPPAVGVVQTKKLSGSAAAAVGNSISNNSSRPAKLFTWTLYAMLLVTISVSRVFLGCHFPHQCLAGAALGLLVAKWVSTLDTRALHFIGASVFLFVTAFGTFGLLQALDFNPSWTIGLAIKHCIKREYIHLDTAPFFSIMRYCGFALGCGLGLLLPLKNYAGRLAESSAGGQNIVAQVAAVDGDQVDADKQSTNPFSSRNVSWFSIKLIMAMLMARLVDNLGLFVSHASLPIFYSSAFLAYTLFSFAFINL